MKKIFFLTLFILTIPSLKAGCDNGTIIYGSSSGFGISFGIGGSRIDISDKQSINLPIKNPDGSFGCYKKISGISIEQQQKEDKSKIEIKINPIKVTFEGLNNPRALEYIFIKKAEKIFEYEINLSAFICVENKVVSIESKNATLLEILMAPKNDVRIETRRTFATGIPAENLKLQRNNDYLFFIALAKSLGYKGTDVLDDRQNYETPNVVVQSQTRIISDMAYEMASRYSTNNEAIPVNPCSSEFVTLMKRYEIKNYKENESLKDLTISKPWFSNSINIKFQD